MSRKYWIDGQGNLGGAEVVIIGHHPTRLEDLPPGIPVFWVGPERSGIPDCSDFHKVIVGQEEVSLILQQMERRLQDPAKNCLSILNVVFLSLYLKSRDPRRYGVLLEVEK